MAKKEIIPEIVKNEIASKAEAFNAKYLSKKSCKYCPQIKGKFIYLMRTTHYGSL